LIDASVKKETLKKERKTNSGKTYFKKGYYPLNDIYYDIFQRGDSLYYFSFVSSNGLTVLQTEDIGGFKTLEDAERVVEEVVKYAREKKRFEINTTADGKFFYNLYNEKGQKIGQSFYFRKILNQDPNIIPISQTAMEENIKKEKEARLAEEEKRKKEKELSHKRWLDEKKKRQEEKEAKAREIEILLADKKEKRRKEKIKKENERKEAIKQNAGRDPMKDDDIFDGCFRWLWIILLFLLLALAFSYFKGILSRIYNLMPLKVRIKTALPRTSKEKTH